MTAPSPEPPPPPQPAHPRPPKWPEPICASALLLLALFLLHLAWRKWPDPMVDAGSQLYGFWRVSQGALPYHDFLWNYGPLSLALYGLLFKCFAPSILLVVSANLFVYGAILTLAYAALRAAWGWPAACAAAAVFISIFSFSNFNRVVNYNFAFPYSHEATHGLLLLLLLLPLVARWSRGPSARLAFAAGLGAGLALLLKPEIILAAGTLLLAGLFLRRLQNQPWRPAEFAGLAAGAALPTLSFAVWFARSEPWSDALRDASQAWWVLVKPRTSQMFLGQASFSGFDAPLANLLLEARAASAALLLLGALWASGFFLNRPRPIHWRLSAALAAALTAAALLCVVSLDGGWFHVGRCLPGLLILAWGVVWRDRARLHTTTELVNSIAPPRASSPLSPPQVLRNFSEGGSGESAKEKAQPAIEWAKCAHEHNAPSVSSPLSPPSGERDRERGTFVPGFMGWSSFHQPEAMSRGVPLPRSQVFALLLLTLSTALLARIFLRARVDHFGFVLAPLAAMTITALLVSKLPAWTGPGAPGRLAAGAGLLLTLGLACVFLSLQSYAHCVDQSQPVAAGPDRFYADAADIDEAGWLVNWSVNEVRALPPDANLLVLPEGLMVNYLARRPSPAMPDLQMEPAGEAAYIGQLSRVRPDYILWITRDISEAGVAKYGSAGQPGEKLLDWVEQNYAPISFRHGQKKNATLLQRKELPPSATN